jgi:hypothetical protein
MAFRNKNYIKGLTAIIFLLLAGFTEVLPDFPQARFLDMDGTLATHHFENEGDSLSSPEIIELQDENGLPVWFGRHFFKDVCMTGECKMIHVSLFWDGAGNYLGMDIPEEEPLTKSDHTAFEAADYEKLDAILGDTASILKDLKSEELIIVPDSIDLYKAYEVDGYTAATRPGLAEVVVKDAVYTCHTLWHTVYGPTQKEIHKILESRLNEEYLSLMLNSQNPAYRSWAIRGIEKHREYHETFYQQIINCIKSENTELANKAHGYFQPELLKDTTIQNKLVDTMPAVDMNFRYEILWKLIGLEKVDEKAVLKLLHLFEEKTLGIGAYNLVLRLVSPDHLKNNNEISQLVNNFSEHENGYIRNLTQRLLKENMPVAN